MKHQPRMMFQATPNMMRRAIELEIGIHREDGQIDVAAPLTMTRLTDGNRAPAAISMSIEDAQALMDELWRSGVRPAEGIGSAGQAAATEKHLQDMRLLAFHALKVPQGRSADIVRIEKVQP